MMLRKVTLSLTEKQYDALCRTTAKVGKTATEVIQDFAEELPSNQQLAEWLVLHQKNNFLSYLEENKKTELVISLFQKILAYQSNISAAYAAGKKFEVSKIADKLETSWKLIQEEYTRYTKVNKNAQPLMDELQTVKEWRL